MLTADTISGFSGSLLQKNFDGAVSTPDCHMEWWELCCSKNKRVAIAAPRGHAKTTAITITYTLACLLFRERSYALIVSDTTTQAEQFLGELRNKLINNDQIRSLFKIQELVKDTENTINIHRYCETWKLVVNLIKCKRCIFSQPRP